MGVPPHRADDDGHEDRTAVTSPVGRDGRAAGLLLSIAGVAILMGSITAEALHPGPYTTHADSLSHLGATEPPHSIVVQPSAGVFDGTVLVAGALILLGAWFAHRALHRRSTTVPTALLGFGVLGVGVFPLTSPAMHTLFAMVAFYAGGIAMLLSARLTPSPFRQLWSVLGAVSLIAITLGVVALNWSPVAALGEGGIERWNSYPIVLWLVAFGSHLISTSASEPEASGSRVAAAPPARPVSSPEGTRTLAP